VLGWTSSGGGGCHAIIVGVRRALAFGAVVTAGLLVVLIGGRSGEDSPLRSSEIALLCRPNVAEVPQSQWRRPRAICVWDDAADRPRVLVRVPAGSVDHWPAWSPDGARIAFVRSRYGSDGSADHQLLVVRSDGSHPVRVASDLADPLHRAPFAWAPDARRIAVTRSLPAGSGARASTSSRGPGDVYVVDVEAGTTRRLTRDPRDDSIPVWIGRRLLYVRREARTPRRSRSQLRVAGAGHDRILRRFARTIIIDLVPSPDGTKVALAQEGAKQPALSVLDVDGGRLNVLIKEPDVYGTPSHVSWSPDARLLAFDTGGMVGVLDVATRELVGDEHVPCSRPEWSPDGRWLACSVWYGEERPERRGGADVLLVDPATRARTLLTDSGRAAGARWRPLARRTTG